MRYKYKRLLPLQARFLLALIAAGGMKLRDDFGQGYIPDKTCARKGWVDVDSYGDMIAITDEGRSCVKRRLPGEYERALSKAIPQAVRGGPAIAARIIAEARTSGQIQVFTCNMGGRA